MSRYLRLLLGVVLIACGLSLLATVVVQPIRWARETEQAQETLVGQVPDHAVTTGADRIPVARPVGRGEAFVVMRIPRFGADWVWVCVEGTGADELADGPGHYPGTPLPGASGNVAFAGHRAGHGDPFIDVDRLRSGDLVRVEQGDARWSYRVTGAAAVVPTSATWVLGATPGRTLTLTTCWPRYGSSERMYVRATLVRAAISTERGWVSTWSAPRA